MPRVFATLVKLGACALGEARSPSRTAWHSAQIAWAKTKPYLALPLSSAMAALANALAVNARVNLKIANFIGCVLRTTDQ